MGLIVQLPGTTLAGEGEQGMTTIRLETTVSGSQGEAVSALADELGVPKSELLGEAVALLVMAAREARKGRRLATMSPEGSGTVTQLLTPLLSQLEWAANVERIRLPAAEFHKVAAAVAKPSKPNAALKRLMGKKAS